jgi:predicted nuclease of predicted toxin-antitoxin system
MGINFFFDEGLGKNLAIGLRLLGKNVEHVLEKYPPGTKDEIWLDYVGKNNLVLVTKDKGIKKKPNEKALLIKYKIVAFYLGGSEKSGHDIVKQLINAWENMELKAHQQIKTGMAGAFLINPQGRTIDPIPLT